MVWGQYADSWCIFSSCWRGRVKVKAVLGGPAVSRTASLFSVALLLSVVWQHAPTPSWPRMALGPACGAQWGPMLYLNSACACKLFWCTSYTMMQQGLKYTTFCDVSRMLIMILICPRIWTANLCYIVPDIPLKMHSSVSVMHRASLAE